MSESYDVVVIGAGPGVKVGFFLVVLMMAVTANKDHLKHIQEATHGFIKGLADDQDFEVPQECLNERSAMKFFEVVQHYHEIDIKRDPVIKFYQVAKELFHFVHEEFGKNCKFGRIAHGIHRHCADAGCQPHEIFERVNADFETVDNLLIALDELIFRNGERAALAGFYLGQVTSKAFDFVIPAHDEEDIEEFYNERRHLAAVEDFYPHNFTFGLVKGMEKNPKQTCPCEDDVDLANNSVMELYEVVMQLINEFSFDYAKFTSAIVELYQISGNFYDNCRGEKFMERLNELMSLDGLFGLITRISMNIFKVQKNVNMILSGVDYDVGFGIGNISSIVLNFYVDK